MNADIDWTHFSEASESVLQTNGVCEVVSSVALVHYVHLEPTQSVERMKEEEEVENLFKQGNEAGKCFIRQLPHLKQIDSVELQILGEVAHHQN